MKKFVLLMLVSFLIASCGTKNQKQKSIENDSETTVTVYSVDELLENPAVLIGKEVLVKGTVMHVCKQGGGRCFLMGSNEDYNIRIEAGEKIGAFSQGQMGADLTVKGIFKVVRTEADAHNPSGEHGGSEHEHDEAADEAHQIILKAQEQSEAEYFMEGIEVVKEEI
ncbi:MAG TPA: hypothetical protein VFD91_01795 [Mariniphaga sp.]|nr:hypothetical protein [Mariniphaga sp.]